MTVSFPGCAAGEGKSALNITLEPFLSHSPVSFSPLVISLLLAIVDHSLLSFHPLLLQSYDLLSTVAPASTFFIRLLHERNVEDAPLGITNEARRRMAGYPEPMKRRIAYS
jgi:hypothetical protein